MLRRLARRGVGGLLDAVLPRTCLATNAWLTDAFAPVAPAVAYEIRRLCKIPYCPRCARTARPETVHDDQCVGCRSEHFWNLREIVRLGPYEGPLRRLLLDVKYAGHERNLDYLAELLAVELKSRPWLPEIDRLVPVPMHRLRRWQRPCDHAELLAVALSERLGLRVASVLRQTTYRRSQVRARSRNERFDNVRGALAARSPASINDKCVCIVDNMATSGATLHEASKVLRAAGAKRVYAVICARAALAVAPQPISP